MSLYRIMTSLIFIPVILPNVDIVTHGSDDDFVPMQNSIESLTEICLMERPQSSYGGCGHVTYVMYTGKMANTQ